MKIQTARFIRGCSAVEQLPTDNLPVIGLCGRSNCGKSTLINTLTRRKGLAKVSRTPGRTRQLNLFLCNERFYLIDLPGFGFVKANKQMQRKLGELITEFIEAAPRLDGIVQLLDIRHKPSVHDQIMWEFLLEHEVPTLHVATKSDKIGQNQRPKHLKQLREGLGLAGEAPIQVVSSLKNKGLRELLGKIERSFLLNSQDSLIR